MINNEEPNAQPFSQDVQTFATKVKYELDDKDKLFRIGLWYIMANYNYTKELKKK